uniref:Dynein intermediate chain n=2 Tax=Pararge aegeria TaxID=116150 RepID=S4PTQ3_9NEOP
MSEGGVAFNRVSWSPSGGHVTAGDDSGKIWVYELAESVAQPRHDEWSKLVYTLQELRNNQADEETDRLSLATSLTSLSSLASNPLR